MKKEQKAFTLAEVLVTLGIIGVVAAMTIPLLINSYQNAQYLTAFKKAYSTFNQVLTQIALDQGSPGDLSGTGLFASSGTDDTSFGDIFVTYFKTIKNCKIATGTNCWPAVSTLNYDGSGINLGIDNWGQYKFITTDGMSVYVRNFKNNCDSPTYSTGRTGNMTQVCGNLYVDTNGLKPPNRAGLDTFGFYITNGKGPLAYPIGGADDAYSGAAGVDSWWNSSGGMRYCCPANKMGLYCSGRIIEEGWKINY